MDSRLAGACSWLTKEVMQVPMLGGAKLDQYSDPGRVAVRFGTSRVDVENASTRRLRHLVSVSARDGTVSSHQAFPSPGGVLWLPSPSGRWVFSITAKAKNGGGGGDAPPEYTLDLYDQRSGQVVLSQSTKGLHDSVLMPPQDIGGAAWRPDESAVVYIAKVKAPARTTAGASADQSGFFAHSSKRIVKAAGGGKDDGKNVVKTSGDSTATGAGTGGSQTVGSAPAGASTRGVGEGEEKTKNGHPSENSVWTSVDGDPLSYANEPYAYTADWGERTGDTGYTGMFVWSFAQSGSGQEGSQGPHLDMLPSLAVSGDGKTQTEASTTTTATTAISATTTTTTATVTDQTADSASGTGNSKPSGNLSSCGWQGTLREVRIPQYVDEVDGHKLTVSFTVAQPAFTPRLPCVCDCAGTSHSTTTAEDGSGCARVEGECGGAGRSGLVCVVWPDLPYKLGIRAYNTRRSRLLFLPDPTVVSPGSQGSSGSGKHGSQKPCGDANPGSGQQSQTGAGGGDGDQRAVCRCSCHWGATGGHGAHWLLPTRPVDHAPLGPYFATQGTLMSYSSTRQSMVHMAHSDVVVFDFVQVWRDAVRRRGPRPTLSPVLVCAQQCLPVLQRVVYWVGPRTLLVTRIRNGTRQVLVVCVGGGGRASRVGVLHPRLSASFWTEGSARHRVQFDRQLVDDDGGPSGVSGQPPSGTSTTPSSRCYASPASSSSSAGTGTPASSHSDSTDKDPTAVPVVSRRSVLHDRHACGVAVRDARVVQWPASLVSSGHTAQDGVQDSGEGKQCSSTQDGTGPAVSPLRLYARGSAANSTVETSRTSQSLPNGDAEGGDLVSCLVVLVAVSSVVRPRALFLCVLPLSGPQGGANLSTWTAVGPQDTAPWAYHGGDRLASLPCLSHLLWDGSHRRLQSHCVLGRVYSGLQLCRATVPVPRGCSRDAALRPLVGDARFLTGLRSSEVQRVNPLRDGPEGKAPPVPEDGPESFETVLYYQRAAGANGQAAPLVLFPHGGPHSCFDVSFYSGFLMLALSGCSVALVNYRGSFGYSPACVNVLPGHCGSMDVDDCVSALVHTLRLGGAPTASTHSSADEGTEGTGQTTPTSSLTLPGFRCDGRRVAVFGGSHGGFLSLHLIGQFPGLFTAAVSRNPVVDVGAMVQLTDIPDWCFFEAGCPVVLHDDLFQAVWASLDDTVDFTRLQQQQQQQQQQQPQQQPPGTTDKAEGSTTDDAPTSSSPANHQDQLPRAITRPDTLRLWACSPHRFMERVRGTALLILIGMKDLRVPMPPALAYVRGLAQLQIRRRRLRVPGAATERLARLLKYPKLTHGLADDVETMVHAWVNVLHGLLVPLAQ